MNQVESHTKGGGCLKAFLKKVNGLIKKNVSHQYKRADLTHLNQAKKIIYISHSSPHKSGGDKVIYKHSQLINDLGELGYLSQVLHPENVDFSHDWFEHHVQFKKDLMFHPQTDFVVLPEIWATPHAKKFTELSIKYAIFVQNPYFIDVPLAIYPNESLHDAYLNASLILSISDDTTECLRLTFPSCADKILRIHTSVDAAKFKADLKKENMITYMPRKLGKHSKLVTLFLKNNLHNDWQIKPIDGLNENGVAELLRKSKIFLSFSEFEGLGLPPIEAALSHNYVVGYTGEGGKDYWQAPLFTEVQSGNIRDFVAKITEKIDYLNQHDFSEHDAVRKLTSRYSAKNENESISRFLAAVDAIINKTNYMKS